MKDKAEGREGWANDPRPEAQGAGEKTQYVECTQTTDQGQAGQARLQ